MKSRITLALLVVGSLTAACSSPPVKPKTYTLGGTVSGLSGTGLVLQNEGANSLTVTQNGPFTFSQVISASTAYFITVLTEPTAPAQTCTIASAQGTIGSANITNIGVTCTTDTATIGGSVTGLAGTGLVLEDNGGDDLTVSANGTFAFATPVANGAAYAVTVKAQPTMPVQTCAVTSGSGTVGSEPVANVLVTCTTSTFTIGGSISGLAGSGLVLEDNGGDDLTVNSGSSFTFATPIASGSTYTVTIKTQPTTPTQTCTVSGGSGTVVAGAVTSITVNCSSNTYTVGGVVIGLAGTGLVLQDNGGDNLSVTANGLFAFATPIASGATFDVTVLTQPAGPTQTCKVTGATGSVATSNVISVSVACTANTYALSGTISGLKGSGLVLQDNLGDDLTVMAGATTFAFLSPLPSGATYAIAVGTQPTGPSQTCVVSNDATGTIGSTPITDIVVTCTTSTYSVGGTVIGLQGSGLVLQDNGGDNLGIGANGLFSFPTPVSSGAAFAVTVLTQPSNPAQTCVVAGATGTIVSANANTVTVNCASNQYTISGTTTGLAGSGLELSLNGQAELSVQSNGTFSFPQTLASGAPYSVLILAQPTNPTQTCAISGGAGTVGAVNVTSIAVTCGTDSFSIGGAVIGLAGTGLVLQDNGGDNLSVTANGLFSFKTPVASGGTYSVTVLTQPGNPTQTCTVAGATGTVVMSSITTVVISCGTNAYPVSGTITGLVGSGLVLQDNGGDNVAVTPGATTFAFPTPLAGGQTYAIAVAAQPTSPAQTCVVSNDPSGTIAGAPVTNVAVTCTTNVYPVGGVVIGLTGTGLVLQDNGGDNYMVTGNGLFSFATPLASGTTFAVTVATQPSNPAQTCVVTGATGNVVNAAIDSVTVNCASNQYSISGTTTGLLGSGLQLSLNGQVALSVPTNGTFSFSQTLASGAPYAVSILAQPTNPTQACVISGGAGTVGAANVTSIVVNCGTNSYTIGGAITGLSGSGLVLQDNGGDNLSLTANGLFSFATPLASGSAYSVTVLTQPGTPTQTCTVTGSAGTVVMSNIVTVVVTCSSDAFPVSGTISGLSGGGLVLLDNGGDNVAVMAGATTFAFPTPLPSGAAYSVAVATQPSVPTQTCVVSNRTGTIGNSAVTNVAVTCTTNSYSVGGTVIGMAGRGLVLQDNGGDNYAVAGNGTFTFATPVASEGAFSVTVLTQPAAPAQTCVVSGASGTVVNAAVTSVTVNCGLNDYTVSGTTTGLEGTGLVLSLNGGAGLAVESNGTFSFPEALTDGTPYAVAILVQPTGPSQTCTLSGAKGTIAAASVSSIAVSCSANNYPITVTASGVAGSGLVLEDNGGDSLSIPASGTFTFATLVASGTTYAVTVANQPSMLSQTCFVANGSGTVAGAAVSNVVVTCTTNTYTVSGTISGLVGAGLVLQDNGADTLIVTPPTAIAGLVIADAGMVDSGMVDAGMIDSGMIDAGMIDSGMVEEDAGVLDGGAGGPAPSVAFTFSASVASGSPYAVTVSQQPGSPSQTCTVTNDPSGTVTSAAVSDVAVVCTTNTYNVDVTVVGLLGTGLIIGDNVGDMVPVGSNGVVTLPTKQASATTYAVTVVAQPTGPAQTCAVLGGTGTVGGSDVTGITVNCALNSYTVSGTVSGLSGSGLQLADNVGDVVPISGDGTFSFPTPYASGAPYAVTVSTQPQSPWQTCTVASGSGTIGTGNVTGISVTCATNPYTVSVNVVGLSGGGLQLADNSSDVLSVTQDGASTFAIPVLSGAPYSVTVVSQPTTPWQTCTITSGSGTVAGANIAFAVSCTTNPYVVSVSVSGLAGSGLQLLDNGGDTLSATANGTFPFATSIASGAIYDVTVATQPAGPTQVCAVSSPTGTVAGAPVTVSVSCLTASYTIGGVVTGLAASESVQLTNGSDVISVTASGAFTFDAAVASGSTYAVTVTGQPTSPVAQTCTVTNGSGTVAGANITNVAVACARNTYTIGGTLTGYSGSGLVLENNGGANLTISAGATTFTWPTPLSSGAAYLVAVQTQPSSPWQTCTVANASGTIMGASVTNVAVTCSTNSYTVGGTIAGLAGGSVVLQNNISSNTVSVSVDGTFQFPAVASGGAYAVTVQTQPSSPTQTCAVSNGAGTMAGAAVTNIAVTCSTTALTVGGTISGYSGSGLQLQLNGANTLTVGSSATTFAFGTLVASGATYAVSVLTQPASPTQVCTVASGTGTVGASNVTNVAITCSTTTYTIGGAVTGLAGGSVVLQDNTSSNTVTISSNGTFQFPAQASGTTYAVTVQTQPTSPSESCSVANGTGSISSAVVTNILVTCSTSAFTVGGTISGYSGSGLQLQLNGGGTLSPTSGATSFTFSGSIASGGTYAVSVLTQPSSPTQSCSVASGTGTVTTGNISGVAVTCTTSSFTVGGTVTGLSSNSVVLQNNTSSNTVTVSASGSFQFSAQASNTAYAVTVKTQPSSPTETCTVTNGTGTVSTGPVTNIAVVCVTAGFTVGGAISGLSGSGLVLLLNGENNLTVSAGASSFTFSSPTILSGAPYAVTVATQPSGPTQTCSISSGTGTIGSANVSNVSISCTTNSYSISVTVDGLNGTLVVENNGGNNLTFTGNGTQTFSTPLSSGASYSVTISSQPAGNCSVINGSGTITNDNITNVDVACSISSGYATAQLSGGTKLTVFVYAPPGTSFTSNTNYAAWCTQAGFTQNQNDNTGPFQTAGMYSATNYYCTSYCCFLGAGNGEASRLSGFENYGLPLDTYLEVVDRGCAQWCTGIFTSDVNTSDALYVTGTTSYSYDTNYFGGSNYCDAKTVTVGSSGGVIVCESN